MKTLLIASLLASAVAFAPTSTKSKCSCSSALKVFDYEVGAQPPLGFFDPLGLVADGDLENFDRLRYVELKHGRISMLAVVGYLVTEAGYRLPGDIDLSGRTFESIPSGFSALSVIQPAGIAQIFFFVGFLGEFIRLFPIQRWYRNRVVMEHLTKHVEILILSFRTKRRNFYYEGHCWRGIPW